MTIGNRQSFSILGPALIAALVASGCDSSYPKEWAPLDRKLLAAVSPACPDISGSYRLSPSQSRSLGLLDESFLGKRGLRTRPKSAWEFMTLSGDMEKQIVVTVARSPEAIAQWRERVNERTRAWYDEVMSPEYRWGRFDSLSDEQYEKRFMYQFLWPTWSFTLHRGIDYSCGQGWLRSPLWKAGEGKTEDGVDRPSEFVGETLVARDKRGYLVVKKEYKKAVSIGFWCGDRCDSFDLWHKTIEDWEHWAPTEAPWGGKAHRPWAQRPAAPRPVPEAAPAAKPEPPARSKYVLFIDSLRPAMPKGVVIAHYAIVGQGFRATFRVPDKDAIAGVLRELAKVPAIESVELIETRRDRLGDLEAVIFLKAPGGNLTGYQ